MTIVTKTGDRGQTGLFGGKRLSKAHARIHAYGTVDELNAVLGLTLSEEGIPKTLRRELLCVQRLLFRVGADLATPLDSKATILRMNAENIAEIERWITALEAGLPPLTRFILPSGSRLGSSLHLARTVCRRAERWIVALGETEAINAHVQVYLNRLSDYFFLVARVVNRESGMPEVEV